LKHKTVNRSKLYKVSDGNVERVGKLCPRCGEGNFMAKHKDRYYCGRCKYTEFTGGTSK
jgi:small subunit ribosomal protein S27Ae